MSMDSSRLGEIADLQLGFPFKSSEFTQSRKDRRLLRGDNIAQGVTRWDRAAFWPKDVDVEPRFELREGDVVLAMDRPWIGAGLKFATISTSDLPALLVQRVACLRARSGTDQRYLHYLVAGRAFSDHILAVQTGTAIPHISGQQVLSFHAPRHSYWEQRAIAEVLGALDDKIAANTVLARCVDGLMGVKFIDLLTKADAETGSLGDVATVNGEAVKPQVGGTLRYVDISSVGVGVIERPPEISWEDAPGRARRRLRFGDTVWSTVRPNRRSHGLNLSEDPLLVGSTGLAVLTPRHVGFAYLYEATRLPEFTSYLVSIAGGSAYPAVRAERFADAPVRLVAEAARVQFEVEGQALRMRAAAAGRESALLAETRDTLLPLLMSGTVRVKDAERVVEGVV